MNDNSVAFLWKLRTMPNWVFLLDTIVFLVHGWDLFQSSFAFIFNYVLIVRNLVFLLLFYDCCGQIHERTRLWPIVRHFLIVCLIYIVTCLKLLSILVVKVLFIYNFHIIEWVFNIFWSLAFYLFCLLYIFVIAFRAFTNLWLFKLYSALFCYLIQCFKLVLLFLCLGLMLKVLFLLISLHRELINFISASWMKLYSGIIWKPGRPAELIADRSFITSFTKFMTQ